ncbi:hypothetical protein EW146_g4121 [Bondarzewia mesenterica]|uniref:Flap endonuclease 1 n=1 Tax=Bondarzewia mesenterica TaxID=1095465 RepID=A0A4S4LVF0_9AGAM|nr:hypothetical protein EW146_g4121 [Bondarzewia mesenterica]
MGIKGLTGLLLENSPNAISEHEIKTLFGRKVAIDASMSIYQFLIAVRQKDGEMLQNDAGETTSHLMGFFYRTIRIVENGIKPAYVFDGKPPELKAGVLAKRFERREEAKEGGEEAKETGTTEEMDRFSRRTVKVTREHNEECRKLLGLMGDLQAPSEAEAQCAELARGGKVYAAGSEDMDTLTFHAPILYRHLTFSEAKKQPISEINLQKALEGLDMTMSQFIDLCILLGCDYLEPIKGVGPKSALKLIREHGGLAGVVEHLREKQASKEEAAEDVGLENPGRRRSRGVSRERKKDSTYINSTSDSEERVRKGADKLSKFLNAKQQGRLDGFFTVKPKTFSKKDGPAKKADAKKETKSGKRKTETKEVGSSKKAKK